MDLRELISDLEHRGDLKKVAVALSTRFEISAYMKRASRGPALLFENVKGFKTKIFAGICGRRERVARSLGISKDELHSFLSYSLSNPCMPEERAEAPVKEVNEKPDLMRIPILTHYEKDAGPYITSAIVTARSIDGRIENVSIHRLQVLDEKHMTIRIVPRHLYKICQMAREAGERSLDVGIAIGLHPAIMIAAAAPAPFGTSEYSIANTMLRGQLFLTSCEHVNARVPADAELLLEGRILLDREMDEGPLVDITGTYDIKRKQPVVEIISVSHREDYFYQALLPGGPEHRLLMGINQEARILECVRMVVPRVRGVNLTEGGCGWLHAVVSIEKQTEGDGKNAILAAFGAHPSLKHVVIVDNDIDPYNPEAVEWAIATRFQADKGMIIVSKARGSTLDPSADQELAMTAKLGIDATRSLLKPAEKFELAKIPGEEKIQEG